MRIIDKFKQQELIDERNIWAAGQVKMGMLGGAVGAILGLRYLAVNNDTLNVLSIKKGEPVILYQTKKEDIVEIGSKNGFLWLEIIVKLKTNDFEEIYKLSSNKKMVKEILDLFGK